MLKLRRRHPPAGHRMRILLAALLVVASLPLVAPTTTACHMPLGSQEDTDIFGEPPEGPHPEPVYIYSSDCGGDPGFWICVHYGPVLDQCAGSDW